MSKKEHIKKKMLIESLENSLGIVSTACSKANISRSSFYKWYKEDEDFRKKVDEIDNVKLDFVESQLFKNIQKEKDYSYTQEAIRGVIWRTKKEELTF